MIRARRHLLSPPLVQDVNDLRRDLQLAKTQVCVYVRACERCMKEETRGPLHGQTETEPHACTQSKQAQEKAQSSNTRVKALEKMVADRDVRYQCAHDCVYR